MVLNGDQLDLWKHSENMEQVHVQASHIGALCGQRLVPSGKASGLAPKVASEIAASKCILRLSTWIHS